MGHRRPPTVTRGPWNSSSRSGTDIDGHIFQPFRVVNRGEPGPMKFMRAASYGKRFDSQEQVTAYAIEHGFSQPFYSRPSGFIRLKLPPRSRKFLRTIQDPERRWEVMRKILMTAASWRPGLADYLDSVSQHEGTRAAWEAYMNGHNERRISW